MGARIDPVTVHVDDDEFSIIPYGGMEGLRLLLVLAEAAGPQVEAFIRAAFDLGDTADVDEIDLPSLDLASIPSRLIAAGGETLAIEILSGVRHIKGAKGHALTRLYADGLFAGRPGAFLGIVFEVLKVNYAPFLSQVFSRPNESLPK